MFENKDNQNRLAEDLSDAEIEEIIEDIKKDFGDADLDVLKMNGTIPWNDFIENHLRKKTKFGLEYLQNYLDLEAYDKLMDTENPILSEKERVEASKIPSIKEEMEKGIGPRPAEDASDDEIAKSLIWDIGGPNTTSEAILFMGSEKITMPDLEHHLANKTEIGLENIQMWRDAQETLKEIRAKKENGPSNLSIRTRVREKLSQILEKKEEQRYKK